MPIKLDKRGYITPYNAVTATMKDFQEVFVENFPDSSTRKSLFDGYLKFCEAVTTLIGGHKQWVDGSFTGSKQHPNDIDVLCFIESPILNQKKNELNDLESKAKEHYGVDLYFIEVFPDNHPRRKIFSFDKVYWLNQFTKTKKMGLRKIQYDKGFLELYID